MTILTATFARLRAFFTAVGKSCYDMEFYRAVRARRWTAALRYMAGLHLLLTLAFVTALVPLAFVAKGHAADYLREQLPENAALTLKGGQLSTTLSVPYEVGTDDFRAVIDTSYEGTALPEEALKTDGVLLGRDAVFVRDDAGRGWTTRPFKGLPDAEISKDRTLGWLEANGAWVIAVGAAGFGVLYWLFSVAWTLVSVSAYALLMMLAARIWKVRLPYAAWHAVGLHAITLPVFVGGFFAVLNVTLPFVSTVVLIMIVAAVIADERANPTAASAPQDGPAGPPTPDSVA